MRYAIFICLFLTSIVHASDSFPLGDHVAQCTDTPLMYEPYSNEELSAIHWCVHEQRVAMKDLLSQWNHYEAAKKQLCRERAISDEGTVDYVLLEGCLLNQEA